jgi:hypothetical protein
MFSGIKNNNNNNNNNIGATGTVSKHNRKARN